MAKLKLKELAQELGISNDDAKKILVENGREKNYTRLTIASALEEEDIELLRKKAGSAKAPEKKENAPAEQKAEKAPAPAAEKKEAAAEEKKQQTPQGKPAAPAQPQQGAGQGAPVKKKKKSIIFVNNAAGAQGRGNQQRSGQNQQRGNRPGQPHQIIRPTIKPGAIVGTPRPAQPQQGVKKNAPEKKEQDVIRNQQTAPAPKGEQRNVEKREEIKTVRTNDQGSRNRSEGVQNRPAPGRSFSNPDRPSRSDGGSQGGSRKNQGGNKFGEGNSQQGERGGEGKDKRRLKDNGRKRGNNRFFEEEEETVKTKNKAGRFIKPEKKPEPEEEKIKVITIPEMITIKDLADKMKVRASEIIKKLFMQGQIMTVNQEVDFETAENIAIEYEIICEKEEVVDVIEELLKEDEEDEKLLQPRPPVICVMGHVDHGKTSLLDAIRKTNVTDREAGGITQHIGAYMVKINDQKITFLDTPGHEAFTAMRMRGANSTDIAILVVAADDGVMPQTVEAINHAKAAGIEIIVAVNKIDRPNANIDRVKQELTEYELIPTDWGGSTEFVPVSAKTGEGIDTLLETIILTAEILELRANPNRMGRGLVIEAELDKGRGPVATVLVQKGTLKVGDYISAGIAHGRVRAMVDDKGRRVKEAKPSTPVEILGLSDVPNAGEIFIAHANDKEAKSYADVFESQNKMKKIEETKSKMSLDDLFAKIQEGNLKELNLIVKADVQGSVEAVKQSLMKLSNDEVVVKCIHGGVGAINESDVILASASSAIIIGFNVRPDAMAKATAEREGVDIRLYKVIYQAIEDVEAAMKGMLDPIFEEQVIGHAEVRQIFKASAVGNIAGSYVLDGRFERDCKIRITREGDQIYEGTLASLKRFKDDVKEVKAGFECGLVFDGFDQIQEMDIVEAYIMVEVPR
ncbi:MAG: translation initiation factor IF-2 [Lachnospiraceae bacterium]|nr:translation initiation factor IF-2 [Lachnospiraceae bacterium]